MIFTMRHLHGSFSGSDGAFSLMGYLIVRSARQTRVYVNGEPCGRTNQVLHLPTGVYRVSLRPVGDEPAPEREVRVTPGSALNRPDEVKLS